MITWQEPDPLQWLAQESPSELEASNEARRLSVTEKVAIGSLILGVVSLALQAYFLSRGVR